MEKYFKQISRFNVILSIICLVVFSDCIFLTFHLILKINKMEEIAMEKEIAKITEEMTMPVESEIIKQKVEVTIYNAEESQTDSTPLITASNKKIKLGYIALSRDLEKKYNLKFGDIIYIPILNNYRNYPIFFEFQDRMNKRFTNSVDIFLWDKEKAIRFGRRTFEIYIIKIRS